MLIELYGRNFGCFRDEFRLSMLATDIEPGSDRGIVRVHVEGDDEPLRLLRAVAIYGPNASGKSTVLRAAGTLSRLLRETTRLSSDSSLQSYEPFLLGPSSREPVFLGVKAVVDGLVYQYEMEFTREAFLRERLDRILVDGQAESLFNRNRKRVTGAWLSDQQFALVQRGFRENALLLSLADSLAPSLAKNIAVSLRRLLRYSDPLSGPFAPGVLGGFEAAKRAKEDERFNSWLLEHLKFADLGVVNLEHTPLKPSPQTDYFEFLQVEVMEHQWLREGDSPSRSKRPYQLSLFHDGEEGPVALPYRRESLGTRRIIEWAPLLYDLTHSERPIAAFVDEFDASMHPLLFDAILSRFNCDAPEDSIGQLIFAAHETTPLDAEARHSALRRDQVYLTEKGPHGAARLYSVGEFRERNNLNMRRRYLQGRYGALPSLFDLAE